MVAQEAAAKAAHETILRRESGAARAAVRYFIRTADRPRQGQCLHAHRACFKTTTCFVTTWVVLGRPARSSQIKPDQARSSQIKECQLATCGARLQPNTTLYGARLQPNTTL